MNAKERFMKAIRLEPVDRPPVGAVVTGVTVPMMKEVGIYYPDANHTAKDLANLAASVWTVSQMECIKLPFGMTVEVEVLGAEIDFGTIDTMPTDLYSIWNDPSELVIPEDFFDQKRVPVVLEAISTLRKRYENEVAVISSIVGPFALAAKLFGFDNLFPWIITDPQKVHAVLEKLNKLAIKYAQAQVDAGADAIVLGEATCSGDLISPDTYRDFILPYHKELCAGISAPTILHICGNSSYHLPYIEATGTECYSFDEGIDMAEAQKHLKGKVALAGYVPTVEALLQGTPELVYQASLECLANGVDILAPGCSTPQHTTLENVAAMVKAANDWRDDPSVRENVPAVIAGLKPGGGLPGGKPARKERRRRRDN